ncbi:MAG: FAD-binding oxidoreductase [Kribbellaceae bacterium]|nr:FAD-binding oxidoreductase [Kribbellaceae bacterium]
MTQRKVVVLGGGILGVSTAVHLVRAGAQVVLVTQSELADGASGRSLSWLNSAGVRSTSYHVLRMLGIDRYRTLFAADPHREWLRFDGGVWWTTPDRSDVTRARHEHEVAKGYDSHLVSRPPAGQLAIHNPGEGWVSLPHLIEELAAELIRRGGEVVTGAGRCSVLVENGRARGVHGAAGTEWRGDSVVVACGAATPAVVSELGVTIPDASPLSMLVVTDSVEADLSTVLNTPRAAIRPNPGSTYAVDHSWYEEHIVEHDDGSYSIDERYVKELLAEASALFADDVELQPASWKLGRKPIPGDGRPVFGELDTVPGCHVAFTHSGATLGLIAGELTAYEILTGTRHPLLADFRPSRFQS